METSLSKQLKVGAFTVGGVIVFMVSILLLGGGQFLFKSTYQLRVQFDQVQGLSRGSIVTLSGFPVGNVSEIRFVPGSDNFLEVVMDIDKAYANRITKGSVANVKTQGALGDKYIFIDPSKETSELLRDGDLLISGETGDFIDQIAAKGSQFSVVMDTVNEAHIFLKNLNSEGNSRKLIKSLVESTQSVKQLSDKGRDETLEKLNSILDKLDRGDGTLGALINDPSVYKKITGFLGESRREKFLSPLIDETSTPAITPKRKPSAN